MYKIEINEKHKEKLKEMTEYFYKNEYQSYKIDEICLFCITPLEYFFINWFEYLYFNLINKFDDITIEDLNKIILAYSKDGNVHPIDYIYEVFIIEKNILK